MNKIGIVLLILLNVQMLFSQNNNYSSLVIPPSPTSAVYRQYGNHQPSLSSGSINVPIPLYELKINDFILPITLNYNTSGINVADRPFPCGYGWVLSPGLRITRTILGRPDDHFVMGSLDPRPSGIDEFELLKRGILDRDQCYEHHISLDELFDTQKDIFSLHLPSGNYTFLINKINDSFEVISVGNLLKIDTYKNQLGYINGFKVTDENGIVYKFGLSENELTTNEYVEYVGKYSYITAWMLREIVLPNNSSINFAWRSFLPNENYSMNNVSMFINVQDFKTITCNGEELINVSDEGGVLDYHVYKKLSMLEKITFSSGDITISYKEEANPFVSKLTVRDLNGCICKNIDFIYGEGNSLDQSLLRNIKMNGEVYQFGYNKNRYYKSTTSLDYWGFYNGKSNYSLIPRMALALFSFSGLNWISPPNESRNIGDSDRGVDSELMKAFMLERIDYPTGGYTEFEYEPHAFTDQYPISNMAFAVSPEPLKMGGGLRVSEIRTKSDVKSLINVKKYKYGLNENGLANVLMTPTIDTFIDESCIIEDNKCAGTRTSRRMTINPLSNYSSYLINNPIWYSNVAEYVNGNKTEYVFDNDIDIKSSYDLYRLIKRPFIHACKNLSINGPRLIEQNEYVLNGTQYAKVSQTIWSYKKKSSGLVLNWIIERQSINSVSQSGVNGPDFLTSDSRNFFSPYQNGKIGYTLIPYNINMDYYELENKEVRRVTNIGDIVYNEHYDYKRATQIWKKTITNSHSSECHVTEYKYPYDFVDNIYATMTGKNIISPIIEEINYSNGLEVKRIRKDYADDIRTSGIIRPISIKSSFTGPTGLHTDVSFDKYNSYGNLLQETLSNGLVKSYLWSYAHQYPVAEIINADYNTVNNTLTLLGCNAQTLSSDSSPNINVFNQIKQLTNSLPQAFVSVYRYKPLVGLLNIFQSSGLDNTYNYDDFGRLQSVACNDKKIASYTYNYKETGDPMRINVPIDASYYMSSLLFNHTFSADVTNNKGSLMYDWYVRNSSGSILASAVNVTSNKFTVTLREDGVMTLTCIVRDSSTGKTVSLVQNFTLKTMTEFINVQKTDDPNSSYRRAKADVYCAEACTVRFEINYSRADANVYVKLGSSDVMLMPEAGGTITQDISFSPGWSYVDISIEGYDPSAMVDLRILSVSNGNLCGPSNILYLWP